MQRNFDAERAVDSRGDLDVWNLRVELLAFCSNALILFFTNFGRPSRRVICFLLQTPSLVFRINSTLCLTKLVLKSEYELLRCRTRFPIACFCLFALAVLFEKASLLLLEPKLSQLLSDLSRLVHWSLLLFLFFLLLFLLLIFFFLLIFFLLLLLIFLTVFFFFFFFLFHRNIQLGFRIGYLLTRTDKFVKSVRPVVPTQSWRHALVLRRRWVLDVIAGQHADAIAALWA